MDSLLNQVLNDGSPVQFTGDETPEQRKAMLKAAAKVQADIDRQVAEQQKKANDINKRMAAGSGMRPITDLIDF